MLEDEKNLRRREVGLKQARDLTNRVRCCPGFYKVIGGDDGDENSALLVIARTDSSSAPKLQNVQRLTLFHGFQNQVAFRARCDRLGGEGPGQRQRGLVRRQGLG